MTQSEPLGQRRAPAREFFTHLVQMPPWHRKMLVLAGVLAIAGLLGQAAALISNAGPTPTQAESSRDGRGSTRRSNALADSPDEDPSAAQPEPTRWQRMSPWASRVGIGFIGGFVIGWAFRAFLKTMALVTMAGVAIFASLSYFNVLNLDIEGVESKFKSSTSWVSQQAERMKDGALALIPSSASSVFGMFLGFRRR